MSRIRLVRFNNAEKFMACVKEIPKHNGITNVQPDMGMLQAAFPRRWKNYTFTVWTWNALDDPTQYDYTVYVNLKTRIKRIVGYGYWFNE